MKDTLCEHLNISEYLGYNSLGHEGKAFVDVDTLTDNELFIDPSLILTSDSPWCVEASDVMESYFEAFYEAFKAKDKVRQRKLLSHANEINDTRLGFGGGDNGHGNTVDGLMMKFAPLEILTEQISTLSSASDLPIVIDGFDKDGLSDMLTNILHLQLYEFTAEQMKLRGIEPNGFTSFWTWNHRGGKWSYRENMPAYSCGKGNVLLVPKEIVHRYYLYRPEHFFSQVILAKAQQDNAYVDDKGRERLPFKNELQQEYERKGEGWLHEAVIEFLEDAPESLSEYNRRRRFYYVGRSLTDEKLDQYVYGRLA